MNHDVILGILFLVNCKGGSVPLDSLSAIFSDAWPHNFCVEFHIPTCELLILKTNYKMPVAVERMKNKNHGVRLLMNDNCESGT